MKYFYILFLLGQSLFLNTLHAQSAGQTIRGTVVDKQAQLNLPGVSIAVLNTSPLVGTTTDANGKFKLENIQPGRYDLKINFTGYKEMVMPNVVVNSGKETILEIGMEETISELSEVEVTAVKKNETNNELISVSGRSFSMEEVNRYAGGRSDPARLASNFAGVSSPDDSRNDIVIRGNSPTGVLWRIEGLNIPNPNHFSTIGTTGGPVSAINTNVLKNSDFFTSAFPAEYGNANAGVFDLGFRNGNSEKREHTFQFGALTGLEAMTEGPINKERGSSYLVAYRYAFTSFAQSMGIKVGTAATPFYQDLSFKINGGTTKLGKFTLFGMGGKSHINFLHNEIDTTDLFADPRSDSYFFSDVALGGLKHFIRVNNKSYFNTVIGATYAASEFNQDTIALFADLSPTRVIENKTTRINYNINTSYNSKINSRLFVKIGAIAEIMNLNLKYRNRFQTPYWLNIWDFNDFTQLYQFYAHSKYNLNNKLTLNLGVHAQYLALNNSNSIEPRAGIKYQITNKSSLNAGYGMHSQTQPTDVYFYRALAADGSYNQSNLKLDFTKSHHFVIGYEIQPLRDWRLKSEVYYQQLFNVPVSNLPTSFSMLNTGASFNPNESFDLKNTGTGTNYGLELTIEKFYSKGYYTMFTGTLYESKYKGSDGIERNTAFNGKFVYNILLGKEFKIGKDKRHALSFDVKCTQAGGRYFTPIDTALSRAADVQILKGDQYAFTSRNPNFFRLDVKTGFTYNSKAKKISQSLFFDIQNITNNKNVFAQRYNPITNKVNTAYQIGFFPNFIYRLQF